MKRVISLMLAIAIVFSVVSLPRAKAIAPALAAAPAALSLLGDIAITCGVVFTAHETVEPILDQIYGTMSLEQQEMLETASRNGKYIVDAIDGAYKYVVTVPDQLWDAIKSGIDSLYSPGVVPVNVGTQTTFPVTGVFTTGWVPVGNVLPVEFKMTAGNPSFWLRMENGALNLYNGYGLIRSQTQPVTQVKISLGYIANKWEIKERWTDGTEKTVTTINSGSVVGVTGGSVSHIGDVVAQSGVVDNPTWDYENYHTKKKDIPLPLRQGLLPEALTDAPPISWDEAKAKLLGKTVEDIAAERVDGVPITGTQVITGTEAEIDAPAIPEAGSESNTSLRALMFSKFPFCLPWDIKNAFALLLATPEPPEWEIDLVPGNLKGYMKGETKWEINMEGFEIVGQISRWTATISFCLALMVVTRRIIHS